ncbi:MAG TPA: PEP-CTERM sorting domain-containing protein [Luteolibacter sp.]
MKSSSLPLLLGIVSAFTTTSQAATVFGVNFNAGDTAGNQADGNFGSTWTNVNGAASGENLGVNGTSSAVNIDWASSGYWSAGSWMSTSTTPSNAFGTPISMMRQYLDDGDAATAGYAADMGVSSSDGIGVTVRLQGMSAWLAAESMTGYTIRAFYSSDTGSATFRNISARNGGLVTSTILETIAPTVQGNGQWNGTSVDTGGNSTAGTRGDAVFLSEFTADTLTLTIESRNGSQRGSLAGFVITAMPEPSTALLCGIGMLGLLRRRRNA